MPRFIVYLNKMTCGQTIFLVLAGYDERTATIFMDYLQEQLTQFQAACKPKTNPNSPIPHGSAQRKHKILPIANRTFALCRPIGLLPTITRFPQFGRPPRKIFAVAKSWR